MKPKVLAIVGPTASGKSALGMALAERLQGEIVCMDSMQIYKRLDIGTAKPTKAEQEQIPHHLVDIAQPWQAYTVARYADDAKRVITQITARGRLPVLVGGTGFYLQALTQGLHLGGVRSDPKVRERLKASARDEQGKRRLHDRLRAVDPATAAKLHPNDITRVSRALEVYELTGVPISDQEQPVFESPFEFCLIGTVMDRQLLYRRINARVDIMIKDGLLGEVEALLAEGVPKDAQAMQGIGYKELLAVMTEQRTLADAVSDIKRNTRHYAKRQLTWFRRDEQIHWLNTAEDTAREQALSIAQAFLEGTK